MILPYCKIDGVPTLKDSELEALFQQLQIDGTVDQVFYEGDIQTPEAFVRMVTHVDTHFFCVIDSHQRTIGFVWLNQCEAYTCQGHWVLFKEFVSEEATYTFAEALQELLEKLPYTSFTGVIPTTNIGGNKFMKYSGMALIGVLSKYVTLSTGERVDGNLYYITQKE